MANFVKLCLFLCHLEIHDNNLIIRLCKITFYKKLVLKFEIIQTVHELDGCLPFFLFLCQSGIQDGHHHSTNLS
jgi:hypothetical protein